MRVLFDTNVLIDVLFERHPFVQEAALLFDLTVRGEIGGLLGATSITTLYYLVAKGSTQTMARENIQELLRLFEVAAVNRRVLEAAATSGVDDFEDAVLHEAAHVAGADGIVTRNATDLSEATLPVYTPPELLTALGERTD